MGRPRKPTNVLELHGAFNKNPSRRLERAGEPRPKSPIGSPPKGWDPKTSRGARMRAIWKEIVRTAPDGVLTNADRFHVELTCELMCRVRMGLGKAGDFAQLNALLGKMGLNPSDRSKIDTGIPVKGVADKLGDFQKRKKRA